jgi:hypothetical protein
MMYFRISSILAIEISDLFNADVKKQHLAHALTLLFYSKPGLHRDQI